MQPISLEPYIRFLIRHRFSTLLVLVLITAASAWMIGQGYVSTTLGKTFFGDNPKWLNYLEVSEEFSSDLVVIAAFEEDDILSRESTERIRRAVGKIEASESVVRVQSILNAERIRNDSDELFVEHFVDLAYDDPSRRNGLFEELRHDERVGGLLISESGDHLIIITSFEFKGDEPAEDSPLAIEFVREVLAEEGYAPDEIYLSGFPVFVAEIIYQTKFNIRTLAPVVALLLLITGFLMFHKLWPVTITMLVAFMAMIWTVGFAVLLDREINLMISIIPSIMIVIAFADVIHLCHAYQLELAAGKEKERAIIDSCSDVGLACLFTSITTFTGFAAISFIPTPVFRQMGVVLGFGVASALLLAMTLAPVIFSLLPLPKSERAGISSRVHKWIDVVLAFLQNLAINHSNAVVGAFLAISFVSLYGVFQLNIDKDFARQFVEGNSIREAHEYIADHFSGANFLDIYIDTPSEQGIFEPDHFSEIAAYEKRIEALPVVDHVDSVVEVVRRIYAAMMEGSENPGEFPTTREGLSQVLLLYELSGGNEIETLVDHERQTLRFSVRLNRSEVRSAFEAGEAIEVLGKETLSKGMQARATGINYLIGDWLDSIISGQRRGLLFAGIAITLAMTAALLSFKSGLISMIPNMLPLFVLGGYLGLTRDYTDSDTLVVAMIAIGLGVDDTIHFLMRYRFERARADSRREAMRRSFEFAGRAIVMTSVILVIGFIPMTWGQDSVTHALGTLLPFTVVVALIADLLLVPAMLEKNWIHFEPESPEANRTKKRTSDSSSS